MPASVQLVEVLHSTSPQVDRALEHAGLVQQKHGEELDEKTLVPDDQNRHHAPEQNREPVV